MLRNATIRDMQILLEDYGLWSNESIAYLHQTIDTCHQCQVTKEPKDKSMVSLLDINGSFNECVCIDLLFIDKRVFFHFMNTYTHLRWFNCTSKTFREAIDLFENIWVTQYR